jgi:hypothetical protein
MKRAAFRISSEAPRNSKLNLDSFAVDLCPLFGDGAVPSINSSVFGTNSRFQFYECGARDVTNIG